MTPVMHPDGESFAGILLLFMMLKGIMATDIETVAAQTKRVNAGALVDLPCDLPDSDMANETINWHFQGMPLFYYTDYVYFKARTITSFSEKKHRLTISDVTRRFAGTYSCEHYHDNRIYRKYFYLLVTGRQTPDCDRSYYRMGNIFWGEQSKEARLLCPMECHENVTWKREGDDKFIHKDESISIVPLEKGSVLIINSVEDHHFGMYLCFADRELVKLPLVRNKHFVEDYGYAEEKGEGKEHPYASAPVVYLILMVIFISIPFCCAFVCTQCVCIRRSRGDRVYRREIPNGERIAMRDLQL